MSTKRSVVPEQFKQILKSDERYIAHSYFTEQVTGTKQSYFILTIIREFLYPHSDRFKPLSLVNRQLFSPLVQKFTRTSFFCKDI